MTDIHKSQVAVAGSGFWDIACPRLSPRSIRRIPDFHLPLTADLNPYRGSSATGAIVRATTKYVQTTPTTGEYILPNTGVIGAAFNGLPIRGLHLGSTMTNLIIRNCADFILKSNCSTTGAQADPYGENIGALVEITDPNNYIADVTGVAAAGLSCTGGCWVRAQTGTAGITVQFVPVDGETFGLPILTTVTATTAWQYVSVSGTFGPLVAGDIYMAIVGSANYYAMGATCYTDTANITGVLSQDVEYYTLATPDSFRGDQGVIYMELYPTHPAEDSVARYYWKFSGCYYDPEAGEGGNDGADSFLGILHDSDNTLGFYLFDGSGFAQAVVAVTEANFAQLGHHKIAVKYSASSIKVWLNGALLVENNSPATIGTLAKYPTNSFVLGWSGTPTISADAVISNVKHWGANFPTDAECLVMTI